MQKASVFVYAQKAKCNHQLHRCKHLHVHAAAKYSAKLRRSLYSSTEDFWHLYEIDLLLSETACKGDRETLSSAVANRVEMWEKTAPDISGLSKL